MYQIYNEAPSAEEFLKLRLDSGLSPRALAGIKSGLKQTNYIVTIREDKTLIGMGRIIGDGATTFQICDIAVDPNHQGQGLGKMIMSRLMAWLDDNATENAYVSLIADGDAKHLYAKYGFYSVAPVSEGMHQFLKK